jgi:hypothetical protein
MAEQLHVRPWMCIDQLQHKEEWPTITTAFGRTIWIPPRRYAILVTTNNIPTAAQKSIPIANMKDIITALHSYRVAPEPLNRLLSHLQILESEGGQHLYIHLTNISSQIIRQHLSTDLLMALAVDNYRPQKTWIQHASQNNPCTSFMTETIDEVLTVVLTAQLKTLAYRTLGNSPPPWTQPMTIILTHECLHRNEAVLPERLHRQNEVDQILTSPSTTTTTPTTDEHTMHSSYTPATSTDTGGQTQQDNPESDLHSSSSTTQTTYTSSSHHQEGETQHGQGNVSAATLNVS